MRRQAFLTFGAVSLAIITSTAFLCFSQDRSNDRGNPLLRREQKSAADFLAPSDPHLMELNRRVLLDEKLTRNPERPNVPHEPTVQTLIPVILGLQSRVADLERELAKLKRAVGDASNSK